MWSESSTVTLIFPLIGFKKTILFRLAAAYFPDSEIIEIAFSVLYI